MIRSWPVLSAVALVVLGGGLLYFSYTGPPGAFVHGEREQSAPVTMSYVGAHVCAGCHATDYQAWKGSDHAFAMQRANEQTILGNFDNAMFSYGGTTSTFFQRDGKFFVNTDGPEGKLYDYEIKYTFGIRPLQQYLIEFPDGRIQPLSIAWDARPRTQGGQRWFHLYPNEGIDHNDELHWTRPAQNWNFMCADCHSTGLRKNYDPAKDRFATQWAEINVSCEACHGPGSGHIAWANAKAAGKSSKDDGSKGLTVRFDQRRDAVWTFDETSGNAVRSQPRETEREIAVCAQCHARRGQIADGYEAGKAFFDYYRPTLLTPPLYYPDGQQRGEVYKWGSFLQSKMHASGVTCSDCHEPHSGKLRAEGNAVCVQCHAAPKYDTGLHHHHQPGTSGAHCASCHMPAQTYMVIDPRHDHSFRLPRPDQSVEFGTPNACNGCHTDHDAHWAAQQVREWYGHHPEGYQQFARALFAANAGTMDANAQLRAVAGDPTQPAVARATALANVTAAPRAMIARALHDPNPMVRFGALQSMERASPDDRLALAAPLLSDPVRMVRIEAARLTADLPPAQLSSETRAAFDRAARDYIASQRYDADRAEARVNLGVFYANRNDAAAAEKEMKTAIRLNPFFVPAYVNLADLYRVLSRDADGEKILRAGLEIAPENAMLYHALGLVLVRLKRIDDALKELGKAATLDPGSARFAYVYAVALHSTGRTEEAIARLEKALVVHPNDRDILAALVSFHQATGDTAAVRYAQRLRALNETLTSGK